MDIKGLGESCCGLWLTVPPVTATMSPFMEMEGIGQMRLPVDSLLAWFDRNRRQLPWRLDRDPYRIWVSEVMLQQTQVETVIPYYLKFMARFPTLGSLAEASADEVLNLWQGLGYYQRALNLHRGVREVCLSHQGRVPVDRKSFIRLPGVGDYIAAAVLSIAFERPLAVLDGNVARVSCRYWGISAQPISRKQKEDFRRRLEGEMPRDRCGDFNQAMMELGAMICRSRNWLCLDCPLAVSCSARSMQKVHLYPRRRTAKPRPRYRVALAVISDGHRILIQKRPAKGHLGGLWEFPGGKVKEGESPRDAAIRECKEELACEFMPRKHFDPFLHRYTHFEIEVYPFLGWIAPETPEAVLGQPIHWMALTERRNFAFPSANQRIFTMLGLD